MTPQGQLDALDLLSVVSFAIGLANYTENVDQSTMQDAIKSAVGDIHAHLQEQDEKINHIMEVLDNAQNKEIRT